jgi:hypothetical protein
MYKKTIVAAVAAAIALSSFGVAMAVGQSPQSRSVDGDGIASEEVDGRQVCNGGRHRLHKSIISDQPVEWDEATGTVSLGSITFDVAKGKDTVEVDFNAETRLYGSADDGHWIQVDIYLDGQLMNPNDATSPTALANDGEGWESNSTTVCQRVRKGTHTVTARATLVDFYGSADLRGWLDDWTLELDLYN